MAAEGAAPGGARWSNWSGNQGCAPRLIARPADEDALRAAMLDGAAPVRVVGAGHSFTPLAATDGALINLDRMGGIRSVDKAAKTARIGVGMRLRDISPALEAEGLAFKNLGDINAQSFAGAAGTATHGTGRGFPCLSAEIRAVRLMTATGEIVEASLESDPDLVRAAQVSLGALGVLTEAEVSVTDSFKLRRRSWTERLESVLAQAEARWSAHRNYEFFYIPFSGHCINLTHDETDAAPTVRPPSEDEAALGSLRRLRSVLGWCSPLRRWALSTAMRGATEEDAVDLGWRLLASERLTLFNEIEHHLPPEKALEALQEVIWTIERRHRGVYFPVEVRRTAGDDAWLSPFQGGERISIAVHEDARENHDWLLKDIEPILRRAGGRPHWGKLHSLQAADLEALYPDFERFRALRQRLDPDGRLLNPHLAALFGAQRMRG